MELNNMLPDVARGLSMNTVKALLPAPRPAGLVVRALQTTGMLVARAKVQTVFIDRPLVVLTAIFLAARFFQCSIFLFLKKYPASPGSTDL